jgi:hypothetical protein
VSEAFAQTPGAPPRTTNGQCPSPGPRRARRLPALACRSRRGAGSGARARPDRPADPVAARRGVGDAERAPKAVPRGAVPGQQVVAVRPPWSCRDPMTSGLDPSGRIGTARSSSVRQLIGSPRPASRILTRRSSVGSVGGAAPACTGRGPRGGTRGGGCQRRLDERRRVGALGLRCTRRSTVGHPRLDRHTDSCDRIDFAAGHHATPATIR